jgi:hypothetical protein
VERQLAASKGQEVVEEAEESDSEVDGAAAEEAEVRRQEKLEKARQAKFHFSKFSQIRTEEDFVSVSCHCLASFSCVFTFTPPPFLSGFLVFKEESC